MMRYHEIEDASDWDALVRESDGDLPVDVPDTVLLAQYRKAKRRYEKAATVMRWIIVLILIVTVAVFLSLPANAADFPENGFRSGRPMGFFGEGHDANHDFYRNLYNGNNGSCCNGQDCRPTQAKWNGTTWDVMVNGEWRTMSIMDDYKVLTPEAFARQKRMRWDSQAHVCTNISGMTIYCMIPPASGG